MCCTIVLRLVACVKLSCAAGKIARHLTRIIFPVQLTTSSIGNLTRLIHNITVCVTIQYYLQLTLQVRYIVASNQSTPRPSEHPPVMGGKMSTCLGGIKGCKYKTSSWHSNRFPDADNIGSILLLLFHTTFTVLSLELKKLR